MDEVALFLDNKDQWDQLKLCRAWISDAIWSGDQTFLVTGGDDNGLAALSDWEKMADPCTKCCRDPDCTMCGKLSPNMCDCVDGSHIVTIYLDPGGERVYTIGSAIVESVLPCQGPDAMFERYAIVFREIKDLT